MSELAGLLLVAAALTAVAVFFEPVITDEAWFLQVARRLARGERLYRDVFFGAGPAAIWILALACRLLRPQLLVLRTLTVAYTAASVTACAVWVWTLGATREQALAVAIATLALGIRQLATQNHYGQVSNLTVLLAHAAVACDRLVLAGVLLALSSSSRYPTGIAATGALAGVLVFHSSPGGAGVLLAVWLYALLAVGLLLGPEGARWFARRAVANKGTYLRTGKIGPVAGIRMTMGMRKTEPLPVVVALLAAHSLLPFALAAAVWAVLASGPSLAAVLATSLALLAVFGSLPRCDSPHVVAVAPLALASLGASGLALKAPQAVWLSVAAMSTFLLLLTLVSSARQLHEAYYRRDLPSLRGFPVLSSGGPWPDETAELIATAGPSIFLLDPRAPFFYLSGSLHNPTPFDYPFSSTFGPRGQAEVIEAIEDGSVPWVWKGHDIPDPFRPVELSSFVERRMELVDRVCGGALYRRRPPV